MKKEYVKAKKIHRTLSRKVEFQAAGKVAKYPKVKKEEHIFDVSFRL